MTWVDLIGALVLVCVWKKRTPGGSLLRAICILSVLA
jgi:hypothetical protein